MDKSATYCVMPHMGMGIQNHADFCVCNKNKESWKDNRQQVIHVYKHDVSNVFQSHTRKMMAAKLDHGYQHFSCQTCWDDESVGNTSLRQILNDTFADVEPLPDQPRILMIKPGNTCNFACRMCNPMTSTSWYSDGYELEKANLHSDSWYADDHQTDLISALTFNEYTKTFENIRNSFNSDNVNFWDTMKKWIANLVYIDIYGGEPFLIPAMFELLEHGVNIGAAKNITLQLHTNASIYNQKFLDILSHYKLVNFAVSIDSSIPDQLEYIRHKSNYNTVIENTKKFKKFSNQHSNIKLPVINTITPLNVFYVDQTQQELQQLLGLLVTPNLVTTPEYDIRHLPVAVKNMLKQKIKHPMVTNFLNSTIPGCDVQWPKFCHNTDFLDRTRNQSFAKVFPEWWSHLEPHWVKHEI